VQCHASPKISRKLGNSKWKEVRQTWRVKPKRHSPCNKMIAREEREYFFVKKEIIGYFFMPICLVGTVIYVRL
jgi:hypothetical protein